MSEWNSDLYLKFKSQRTQPATDLVERVKKYNPSDIADLGCGPGNSTAVLRSAFPNARIVGIDSSSAMIGKAKKTCPDTEFKLCDIRNLNEKYDLLFSNACLQWIPDHDTLLPCLMERLNAGGVLAVQIPINGEEPLYRIIRETAEQSEFDFSKAYSEKNDALAPEEYYEILAACSSSFDIWETVYYHDMPSHEDLINWVRSTRLRPYLDCLKEEEKIEFERRILDRVAEHYPVRGNGNVILKFRRLFFTALK